MKRIAVYIVLVVFAVLHQDFWLWDDATLVFGFLPAGLAYHVFYSLAVAFFWYLVVRHAWPEDEEIFAEGPPFDERDEDAAR